MSNEQLAAAIPDDVECLTDPDILECLTSPVVVKSPIRTPEERLQNPSALTMSLKEIWAQLQRDEHAS